MYKKERTWKEDEPGINKFKRYKKERKDFKKHETTQNTHEETKKKIKMNESGLTVFNSYCGWMSEIKAIDNTLLGEWKKVIQSIDVIKSWNYTFIIGYRNADS